MKILCINVSGPALAWLDQFDAIGPRAYGGPTFMGGGGVFVH
jgi:hypothetical protein